MNTFFSPRRQLSIGLSAITGATMMTSYSYFLSWLKNKNFREPKLLGTMAYRLFPQADRKDSQITGWALHYLVGLLFAEAYAPFWPPKPHPAGHAKKGLILGGFSGIAAILIWKFTLNAHPLPPAVHFHRFAGQLFVAHLVFGLFSGLAYSLAQRLK